MEKLDDVIDAIDKRVAELTAYKDNLLPPDTSKMPIEIVIGVKEEIRMEEAKIKELELLKSLIYTS